MRRLTLLSALAFMAAGPSAGNAAVPVADAPILDRRAATSSVKVELLSVGRSTSSNTRGVHCASTTGQRGTSADTSRPVTPNGGASRVQQFDPGITRPPAERTDAGAGTGRAGFDGAATVAGGVEIQQTVVGRTRTQYEAMRERVGSARTYMGSVDENSAVRVQNGITWNQAMQGANLFVQALNTANLLAVAELGSGARAVGTTPRIDPGGPRPRGLCLPGFTGRGTAQDPCRPVSSQCSTTPYGVAPDPGCVARRYVDHLGNVVTYLGHVQSANLSLLVDGGVFPETAARGPGHTATPPLPRQP